MLFKHALTSKNYGPLVQKSIKNALANPKIIRRTAPLVKKKSVITSPFWQKACSNDMWKSEKDWDVSGALNKYSLAPMIASFYAKKEEIITEILGWLTCQAPDWIRPALLAVLQIKRLMELIEYIKCATTILQKIMALIKKTINDVLKAQKALMDYLKEQQRLLASLLQVLLNIPNMLMAGILAGLMKSFQNIVDEVVGAILSSDAFALFTALKTLETALKGTLASLIQAADFAKSFPGQALGQLKSFMDESKRLFDPAQIRDAQDAFKREYGWLLGSGTEGSNIYKAIASADPIDWNNVLERETNALAIQLQLSAAQMSYSDERAYAIADLRRMSIPKLCEYSNSKFASFATSKELAAFSLMLSAPVVDGISERRTILSPEEVVTGGRIEYLNGQKVHVEEVPILGKKACAVALSQLMSANDEKAQSEDALRLEQIREIEKVLVIVTMALDQMEIIKNTEAEIAAMDDQIAGLRAELVTLENTRLDEGVAELQALVNGAYATTITNDNSIFESFDAVTTHELVKRIDNTPVNQWFNVHSVAASGTLVIADSNVAALYVAQSIYDANDTRAIGLRLIIDNGLWIIECYGDGNPDGETVGTTYPATVTYGRFTSVPTAPTPSTLSIITFQEWKIAHNHPSSVTKDRAFTIYSPPDTLDLSSATYHAFNPITGRPWERYLTQDEIDYREANYLEALKAFNLSPRSSAIEANGRYYSLASDSQLGDLLLGKKPYANMQIPARSVNLQIAKIRKGQSTIPDPVNHPERVLTTIVPMPILPGSVFPFAVSAMWGFVPKVL